MCLCVCVGVRVCVYMASGFAAALSDCGHFRCKGYAFQFAERCAHIYESSFGASKYDRSEHSKISVVPFASNCMLLQCVLGSKYTCDA